MFSGFPDWSIMGTMKANVFRSRFLFVTFVLCTPFNCSSADDPKEVSIETTVIVPAMETVRMAWAPNRDFVGVPSSEIIL